MEKLLQLSSYLINQRFPLYVAVLLTIFGYGGYVALNSEVEAFPDVTNVQVQVITQYPGKCLRGS